jgi:hypothetical protein
MTTCLSAGGRAGRHLAMNRFLADITLHEEPITPIAESTASAPMKSRKSETFENIVDVSDGLKAPDAILEYTMSSRIAPKKVEMIHVYSPTRRYWMLFVIVFINFGDLHID